MSTGARVLGSDAARAVGRFRPEGVLGYRAKSGGPLRETRHEAERDEYARHLIDLYAERVRLAAEMARIEHPTRQDAEAVLAAGRALDDECEAFRRRYYPRRARCLVGLFSVMVASATSRRVETVLDLFDEYAAGRDSNPEPCNSGPGA